MHRLVALIIHYGTPLVWFNVFLEQLGAPIPAVPTLVLAGALSRSGKMSSTAVLTGSIVVTLIADYIWFLLGRRLGYKVLRTICRISLSPDSCVRDTESRFERWGIPSLLVAKFVPGFSTVAPPLAGATGASTIEFLLYDTGGAVLWAGTAVVAGRIFFHAVDDVLAVLENLGAWAVVIIACVLVIWIVVKWWQRIQFFRKLRLARVTPEEVKLMLESATPPLIIDVRSATAKKRDPRHLPSAIVIPTDTLPERLKDVPRDQELILYCT